MENGAIKWKAELPLLLWNKLWLILIIWSPREINEKVFIIGFLQEHGAIFALDIVVRNLLYAFVEDCLMNQHYAIPEIQMSEKTDVRKSGFPKTRNPVILEIEMFRILKVKPANDPEMSAM